MFYKPVKLLFICFLIVHSNMPYSKARCRSDRGVLYRVLMRRQVLSQGFILIISRIFNTSIVINILALKTINNLLSLPY